MTHQSEEGLKADAVTLGAAAIVDLWLPTMEWRHRLDESEFLESADWQAAVSYSKAVLRAARPTPDAGDEELIRQLRELSGKIMHEPASEAMRRAADRLSVLGGR